MGVPFEAILPFGLIIGFFGITGVGLSSVRYYQNGYKNPRRGIDAWDKQMMERDLRLTGSLRGQTDNHEAPPGFELSNRWKAEKRIS